MENLSTSAYTAFADNRRIATGSLPYVAVCAHQVLLEQPDTNLLVFDDSTGKVVDVDLRGTREDVQRRAEEDARPAASQEADEATPADRRPGRPKLGVVAREITMLPRHWEWLAEQPGGVSVTLRKLVEAARKADGGAGPSRQSRDAAYRFMQTMAGDEPGFEEASRALFAGDAETFATRIAGWPGDIRAHILHLVDRKPADTPAA